MLPVLHCQRTPLTTPARRGGGGLAVGYSYIQIIEITCGKYVVIVFMPLKCAKLAHFQRPLAETKYCYWSSLEQPPALGCSPPATSRSRLGTTRLLAA